jgi:hypothetical protein
MYKRSYWLGFLTVLSCTSGAGGAPSRSARSAPAPVSRNQPQPPVSKTEAARAPLGDRDQAESDRVFAENAERAIGEYSEFIARAGANEEYAPAVKRSREQIEDLRAALDFVRAGAAERAAREGSHSPP